jgi:DNA-binding Lrp family transcriptional regulator
MFKGFLLINTSPENEHKVYNRLSKISEINELYPLFGEYDLLAQIELKDYDTLINIIQKNIKNIDGILDTKLLNGSKL